MNNGKVRIYDLSKDLHLENKDILNICKNLNISAKSHSSTITEAQAEQIRAMAKRNPPEKRHKSNRPSTKRSPKSERTKQEILSIHRMPAKPTESGVIEKPTSESPAPSASPTLIEPPRPASGKEKKHKLDSSVSKSQTPAPSPAPKPEPASSHSLSPQEADQQDQDRPKLIGPPSRQALTKDEGKKRTQSPKKKALILKKNAPDSSKRSPKADRSESTTEERKKDKALMTTGEGSGKPQQKLKRPPSLDQRKKAKEEVLPSEGIDEDEELVTTDEENIIEEEETLLKPPKRPQPKLKRPVGLKKTKNWEEEDDEEELFKAKAKSGTKKRRPKPLIEDDDELEELNSALNTTQGFSLSTARPPKPKSTQPQATPSAKKKKPATKPDPRSGEKQREKTKSEGRRDRNAPKTRPEIVVLPDTCTIRELSELLCIAETDIIKSLFFKGIAVNITQTLDRETAMMVAEEFEILVDTEEETAAATKVTEWLDVQDLENLQRRPPVVTIMGHVDHGKTTLLDSIRQTKVAQGEAGGITQHIGAYHVDLEHNGKTEQIVFLDTPGHEAFTAMRARGARVTDIAILVVAADDGVQPQTKEAISHAKAAEVPLVVAINKVDKPESQPDRIKQELMELNLVPEEWGGETIMVPVSALKGENLDTLLEMLLLVSEVEELSANPDRPAKGTVIEAHLDRSRGPVATLLVQNGTLRVGDTIVAGSVLGKIRAMIDDRGDKVEAATPSFAVEILGLGSVPEAGDEFDVFASDKEARALAEKRQEKKRLSDLQQSMSSPRVTLSSLSAKAQEGELKQLNLILKADVQGSVEAILGSLRQLPQEEVQIRVLHASPGEVTETDVDLAAASGAVVIGFNTTLASGARLAADVEGVDIREYNIIYKLLDDIQGAMEGLLDPEEVEEHLGKAEVRAVFSVGKGAVAGCYILSGKVIRNRLMRVYRKEKIIYEGVLDSLKRFNEDAKEVASGYECGMGSSKFNNWQEGDVIEVYQMVMKRRTLAT